MGCLNQCRLLYCYRRDKYFLVTKSRLHIQDPHTSKCTGRILERRHVLMDYNFVGGNL